MCGIAGLFRRDERGDEIEIVRRMLVGLHRRGPDDEGLFRDGPVTLGHRRLAILDTSDAGHQPMRSPSGRHIVVFNGEIYNFQELRLELGIAREDLRTRSDTEILLLAWERWSEAALDRLVGQFAFALYDGDMRRLWLARDRFGEKPLFYHRSERAFTFASSISALLRVPWIEGELDPASLAEFATMRYVISPRTVLRGIRKLPPGSIMIPDPESDSEPRGWYRIPFHDPASARPCFDAAEATERFGELLAQATRRCAVSDVPVGLLLSDGIDSGSIDYSMRLAGLDCPAFTYHAVEGGASSPRMNGPATDRERGRFHVYATPQARLEMVIPALAGLTEPIGDGAAVATWWLIRSHRDRVVVFLCGHGGDEVLGGYRMNQDRLRLAWMRRVAGLAGQWLDPLVARYTNGSESIAARRKAIARACPAEIPALARYIIHRPLPFDQVLRLFHPHSIDEPYLSTVDRLYTECPAGTEDLTRMQHVLLKTFLTENILTFADAVAMDSSAELRMPFLDRDLVQFVLTLPDRMRVGHGPGRGETKKVLRSWGKGRLPHQLLIGRKRPFASGSIRDLFALPGGSLKASMLEQPALRRAFPGLENWLGETEISLGRWEGTTWALLALAIWCNAQGIR